MPKKFTRQQAKYRTNRATDGLVKLIGQYKNVETKTLFEDETGQFYATPHNVWNGSRNPKTHYKRAKETYYKRFSLEERRLHIQKAKDAMFKKYGKIGGMKPRKGKDQDCIICKKSFYNRPSSLSKYCSIDCSDKGKFKEKEVKKCKNCKKTYEVHKAYLKLRKSKYCSVKCRGLARRKKNDRYSKGRRSFKKILWRFFSKYIRQRDKGICISCGKKDDWKNMDAGHYIPKTAGLSLYFDERNVNSQCTYCNRWMHGNLSRYAIALRIKYGENILEELDEKRKRTMKYTVEDYRRLINYYKSKVEE